MIPVLLKDGYKVGHKDQYPADTEFVYSNFTPRQSRSGYDYVIFFGLQYFIKEYLMKRFSEDFFGVGKDIVLREYSRRITNYTGPIDVSHIARLWEYGSLPLRIKALPEGTLVPTGVPVLTIRNTEPDFFWLTNMLETLMSNILWKGTTSATTAFLYRMAFERYAKETGGDPGFIKWQGHDFSFRGMAGLEDAMMSGAAHLLSFTGTDTIPAIDFLEQYYNANVDRELVGGSVPATEHSVMCMGTPENERETFLRLLTEIYPTGIVSIVSDTWDFWKVIKEIVPSLKDVILNRDGKLVIRPDSGDPTKIICGDIEAETEWERKGAIECLWDIFGGTYSKMGYKELNPHIGLIYGDSITLERQDAILYKLRRKGFASTNVVLGIGSYTYEYVTRDTYGFAMKATWGKTKSGGAMDIYKDPATDSGMKKSHKGFLRVDKDPATGLLVCRQQCTEDEEHGGLLETVFHNGVLKRNHTLAEIRKNVEDNL